MKQTPLFLLTSTLLLSACSDPLIGTWEGTDGSFPGIDVALYIEKKGDGESSVDSASTDYHYRGTLEWEKTDSLEYDIEEECSEVAQDGVFEDCSEQDSFTWKCEMTKDADRLVCHVKQDGVYLRDADGARLKYKFDAAN